MPNSMRVSGSEAIESERIGLCAHSRLCRLETLARPSFASSVDRETAFLENQAA
jgi:hypothetical protein